jgi:ParB family transcriptional regulator, chromosome partitioning protein
MANSTPRNTEPRQRLGRGLAALLGDNRADAPPASQMANVRQVPIEFVRSNSRNPRIHFDEAELEELAASIKERGIIQPIIVRPVSGAADAYEIVAGERRWRAAQRAGQHTVPIISLNIADREALELSIVENVQRADLSALEEAKGYAQLASEYGYNQSDIGRIVGKSRSHVANTLRLLALPEHTQELLRSGAISAGHARALLSLPNPDAVADRIVARGLTVRDVEKLNTVTTPPVVEPKIRDPDPVTKSLEERLSLALGVKAAIQNSKRSREIRIKFKDFEQLEYICNKLMQS